MGYLVHECVNAFKLTARANSQAFGRIITALNKQKVCNTCGKLHAARCVCELSEYLIKAKLLTENVHAYGVSHFVELSRMTSCIHN